LELAAKVYRKQMNKCEYLKGRDATPEKKRRIAELLVKELPNSLQEGLADLFSEEFSKIV